MFINYRLKAKRQMAIFATLAFSTTALLVMSGLAMAEIPWFCFWAMLGVGMVGSSPCSGQSRFHLRID